MPRKPRESSGTGIYHVMLRGINRQDIFDDTEDYWTFIKMMSAVPCYIYAYCLMPNQKQLSDRIAHASQSVRHLVTLISVFVKISIWSFLERGAIQYASDYNRKAMDYSEQLSQEKSKNICRKIRNPWRDGYKSGTFAFCMNAGPLTKIFHEVEDVTIGQDDQMD